MEAREIRSAYSTKKHYGIFFKGETRTKSQFMKDCDVNAIVLRGEANGVIDHINNTPPTYGDATAIDFQESMNTIITANAMFADLPSRTRRFFDNNPAEYLEFCENPENEDQMRKMGLLKPKEKPPEAVSKTSEGEPSGSVVPPEGKPSDDKPSASGTVAT